LTNIARAVAQQLGRDNVRKQRILQRSPHVFAAMDAQELGQASGRELAVKELRELGIEISADDDPVRMLDMHHAGRKYAADFKIPGNRLTGGNTIAGNNGSPIIGSQGAGTGTQEARDSRESGSFVDRYLEE
jgi:hypothetical protein